MTIFLEMRCIFQDNQNQLIQNVRSFEFATTQFYKNHSPPTENQHPQQQNQFIPNKHQFQKQLSTKKDKFTVSPFLLNTI